MCGTAITTGFHWLLWPVVATGQACQWWRLATGQATTYDEISVHPSVCLSLRPADSPVDTACVHGSDAQVAGGAGLWRCCRWRLPMRQMRGLMVCIRLDMSTTWLCHECRLGPSLTTLQRPWSAFQEHNVDKAKGLLYSMSNTECCHQYSDSVQ